MSEEGIRDSIRRKERDSVRRIRDSVSRNERDSVRRRNKRQH